MINTQKLMRVIRAAKITQAIIDKSWIPEELRGPSYFGSYDEWLFNTEESSNVCEECESHNETVFYGNELRSFFPYLSVESENSIYPSVHPNCRCKLIRTTFVEEVIGNE
jgi:hypothetical protein